MQQLGKRVRYFYNNKSGTPIKHNIHMFSSPQNVFFIVKYEFARQHQLPLSGVILVADCIATNYTKVDVNRQVATSVPKSCIEGLYAQGTEVSKEGKMATAQEISVLIKVPPLTIHAFDRVV